jgi:hypothetical protein
MAASAIPSPVRSAAHLRQSPYGLIACVLAMASLFDFGITVLCFSVHDLGREELGTSVPAAAVALHLFGLFLAFIGLVLGLVGVFDRDRLHTSAWVGCAANAIVFAIGVLPVIDFALRPAL